MPWLYLKGVSTGDMQEALEALLGVVGTRSQRAVSSDDLSPQSQVGG